MALFNFFGRNQSRTKIEQKGISVFHIKTIEIICTNIQIINKNNYISINKIVHSAL